MTISQRGSAIIIASAAASASMSVQGTWPTGSTQTAGDLLIAVVTGYGTTSAQEDPPPAGWTEIAGAFNTNAGMDFCSVFYKVAAGGDTAPTFGAATSGTAADSSCNVALYDLFDSGGGTPQIITVGSNNNGSATPMSLTTAGNVPSAGCFAICAVIHSKGTTAATGTWTTPTSWSLGADQTASLRSHMGTFYYSSPPSGSTLTVSVAWPTPTATTNAAGVIIVVRPPVTGALEVTATQTGAAGIVNPGLALTVKVVTGQAASPLGATLSQVATTPNGAITPAATGSWVYGAVTDNNEYMVWTAEPACTFTQAYGDSPDGAGYGTFRTTATTTAATPVTIGATNTGVTHGGLVGLEIKTAGTLAEDASSPPVVVTDSSYAAGTVAFKPPAGSLLVAQVSCDGQGGAASPQTLTVADTSGLTWTPQIVFNTTTNGYTAIWTAPIPAAPTVTVPAREVVLQAVKRASLW